MLFALWSPLFLGITPQFQLFILWPQFLLTLTFRPLFGQITILSLSFVTFRVSHFHVSYLTHETFKLRLQNTLNMSKTARVYFGVLHGNSVIKSSTAQLSLVAQEPVQLRQISPRSLSSSVIKSSTAQLRLGSPGASSAQAD